VIRLLATMYEWALIALRSLSYKAASTRASNSAAARSRYIPYSVVAKVGFHAGILALYKTAFGRTETFARASESKVAW
jgi:hypothetical protein